MSGSWLAYFENQSANQITLIFKKHINDRTNKQLNNAMVTIRHRYVIK